MLKLLIGFAESRGMERKNILSSINISADTLKNEDSLIPAQVFNDAWTLLSNKLNDKHFGLHFGESFAINAQGHFIFTLMKNSRDLESAIKAYYRYHNLLTNFVTPALIINDTDAVMKWDSAIEGESIPRHMAESILSLQATLLYRLTNEKIQIKSISFSHDAPSDFKEYERIFKIKPKFNGKTNQLIFDKKELMREFPHADHQFGSYLRHYAENTEQRQNAATGYSHRITYSLKKSILDGTVYSLETVADLLDMSVRQLQYKLKEEGTSYQELLDSVRSDIAKHLLEQKDIFMCDIAFMLGFSEQSSFNHAFKKWTGSTPGAFRNQQIS